MATFTTVAMKQIQSHLARSRRLWGRRGASEKLAQLTQLPSSETDTEVLLGELLAEFNASHTSKVRIAPDALDIDGVVVFESVDESSVELGRRYATEIHRKLPAVTLELTVVEADRFVDILGATPRLKERYLPSVYDIPLVKYCDECGESPAEVIADENDDRRLEDDLCRDCGTRWNERKSRRLANRRGKTSGFLAETKLMADLQDYLDSHDFLVKPKLDRVETFEELAQISSLFHGSESPSVGVGVDVDSVALESRRRRGSTDNHTMLIFTDANGLGGLFKRAGVEARQLGTTEVMRKISKIVKDWTSKALFDATLAIWPEFKEPQGTRITMPVIPHIVGGDDILVSLPADRGWLFLENFFGSFKRQLADFDLAQVDEKVRQHVSEMKEQISFSAGVVISHASMPFGDQVELAERLMREAKQAVGGKTWSMQWQDTTFDGYGRLGRKVWTWEQVEQFTPALNYYAATMLGNARQRILQAIDPSQPIDVAGFRLWDVAKGSKSILEFLKLCGITDPRHLTESQQQLILDMTSLRRWW